MLEGARARTGAQLYTTPSVRFANVANCASPPFCHALRARKGDSNRDSWMDGVRVVERADAAGRGRT